MIPVRVNGIPSFISVVVAAGTGGSSDIQQVFQSIDKSCPAEFFVVQHGPDWMMKLLARQIKQGVGFSCAVAYQDLQTTRVNIYLAPADHHLTFYPPPPGVVRLLLSDHPTFYKKNSNNKKKKRGRESHSL